MTGPISDDAMRQTPSGSSGAADSAAIARQPEESLDPRPEKGAVKPARSGKETTSGNETTLKRSAAEQICAPDAYATNLEHLLDELKRLDLLIRLRVLQQRKTHPAGQLDQFRGLVVWDEEIDQILADEGVTCNVTSLVAGDEELRAAADQIVEFEAQLRRRRCNTLANGVPLALTRLSDLFNLNPFEELCILICLAPEIDRKYEKLFAYLRDDVTRRKPSVDLVLDLLCRSIDERFQARRAFESRSPLLRNRLIQVVDDPSDGPTTLLGRTLKLDHRIAAFILESDSIDARLEHVARLAFCKDHAARTPINEEVHQKLHSILRSRADGSRSVPKRTLIYFYGAYGSGRGEMVHALARDFDLPVIFADAERMLEGVLPFEDQAQRLAREALLSSAAIAVENMDVLIDDDQKRRPLLSSLIEVIDSFSGMTFLLGSRVWEPQGIADDLAFIACEFAIPDDRTRQSIWKSMLAVYRHQVTEDELSALASMFRFTPGQIRDAIVSARNVAECRTSGSPGIASADLLASCRAQSTSRIGKLARKIETRYRWRDIVLPADQMAQLREICNQVKTRGIVYGDWGFGRKLSLGKGVNALFSGPPGTGKTMAAEVIANELGLDLFRIDLSQVVSKYIGETEKNLSQIFAEARSSNAILFFDEADALFGKRSEVRDSHDRYANIEIGYLLQEMEEYEGVAILATNLRQNMDEAFVRRLQIIIEFPFPDEEHRKRIWQVTFPSEAPIGNSVDFGFLAREIKLSGGNIKNIALTAAFYAASGGGQIAMSHLEEATRREYQKIGWPWNEADWTGQTMHAF